MSRRLRIEEKERLESNKKDFLEQDKLKLRKERIYAPCVWRIIKDNFKVIDLKEKFYDEAVDMIKNHYIPNDVITRNAEIIEDEVSLKSMLDKTYYLLKDSISLAVVLETLPTPSSDTDALPPTPVQELAGVLVLKAIHKVDYGRVFTSLIMSEGEARKKCLQLYATMHRKANVTQQMNCESYINYYYLCVKPEFRHRALGYKLMISGLDVARSLKIPVVAGIFSSYSLQKRAKKLGMQILYEINYVEWRDKNGELIFDDPGAGNYSCILMAANVPEEAIPEPQPPIITVELPIKQPRLTRIQKREKVAKELQKKHGQN